MTDNPTDFIRASREICDKATPEPWFVEEFRGSTWVSCGPNKDASMVFDEFSKRVDQDFAAHARTALPRALDMLEAQQKQLAEQQAEINRLEAAYANQVARVVDNHVNSGKPWPGWRGGLLPSCDCKCGGKP